MSTTTPIVRISSTFAREEDVDFHFLIPERMETERVALVPFIPSKHAQEIFSNCQITPEHPQGLFEWMAVGPYTSAEDFIGSFYNGMIRPDKGNVLFAVYNKNPDGNEELAGLFGYVHTSKDNLNTEIGPAMTWPRFQGTHVTSNATGILLHYALDLPPRGLGLRRVQWLANEYNHASWRAAEKMGFKKEGILRWHYVLTPGKEAGTNGSSIRKGDPREDCPGRDTTSLALCWDDWESGGREKADQRMQKV